jgi:5-methyltetrahydropteroyltriglutamate--homocysteine methyltransferase
VATDKIEAEGARGMQRSTERILTTHVGSLPRPAELIALHQDDAPTATIEPVLASAVHDVVREQLAAGVDVVNDGEFGKATRAAVDYGAWWSYIYERLAGFDIRPGRVYGQTFGPTSSKDRAVFREFYETGQPMSGGGSSASTQRSTAGTRLAQMVCTGQVRYTGHAHIERDVQHLKNAIADVDASDVFMTAVSPATLQILPNEHYARQEEYTWALAEAIREEYRAITDAGFVLQIDDPALVDLYDWWFSLNDDFAGYRKWAEFQVEAVNHALHGIPEEQVRFHICWGSWHGPHSTDVELKNVVDLLLKVRAQAYSVEAANVRHEHEWKVWRDVRLPDGKIVMPGVVSHATNVLEHPELVADRLLRYAHHVGRENVIASTDCGLGGRIHPQLAWAKLRALREGADLASSQLWR